MVQHHTKYIELHGVDEVVEMSRSDHAKLHHRLREEGKCDVPSDELRRISAAARGRSSKHKAYRKVYRAEHIEQRRAYQAENREHINAVQRRRRAAKKLEMTT